MAEYKTGYASGIKIEAGNTAFTTTGTTVAVQTTLTNVIAAIGNTKDASTGAGLYPASAPTGAVTSGSITFTRTDTTSAAKLDYVLFGY